MSSDFSDRFDSDSDQYFDEAEHARMVHALRDQAIFRVAAGTACSVCARLGVCSFTGGINGDAVYAQRWPKPLCGACRKVAK